MKKYNMWMILSLAIYMIIAVVVGYGSYKMAEDSGKVYKVEINRLYHELSAAETVEEALHELDLQAYQYVTGISFLSELRSGEETELEAFFQESKEWETEVRPFLYEGELKGFLRFDYKEPQFYLRSVVWMTQSGLFILEVFVMVILLYLKYQVIRPFQRMSSLPQELAQGHFSGIVKEEKSRFFGQFVWGIGQLKDRLEVTRKRQLELEKEKKKLLLSLSHDIKTPLNTIRLYAKALEENLYCKEEQKVQAAYQIEEKAAEIERYVEEIIQSSREDIFDITVKKEEFYLQDMMQRVLDTYLEKCSIHMIALEVGEYENRLLIGDLERALEVFENIFENAFKYGDGQKIAISFLEEDYCQLIRIFNTGEPVTDQEFNHIFESFFRGSNSEGKPGSGLGLYICREIMQKMDGEIFAEKETHGMAVVLVFR